MIRRIFALTLVALLLTACGMEAKPPETSTTGTEPTQARQEEPQIPKTASVEFLFCRFRNRVLPTDFEVFVGCFPAKEGQAYVDLALRVTNACEYAMDEKDITGYFEYSGKRCKMQFAVEENAGDFANEEKTVPAGETRTEHLFFRVEEAATASALTVHYAVAGETKQAEVAPDTELVLEDKHQLLIGDVFRREGQYSVEVLDCMISNSLRATGSDAVKYYVNGSQVLCLVLKVRNEGASPLTFIEGYVPMGEQPEFATIQMEVNDHKELEDLTGSIAAGEEQILHLWVAVPLGTANGDMPLRCNILGDSFYCYAVG